MKKSTQTIVGVVIIILLAVGGYWIFGRSKSSNPTPASSTTTNATNPNAPIIQTKIASNVGQYLAGSSGNALYTYGGDSQGVGNCTGSCLYGWPIYDASAAPNKLPANVTVITRSDGGKQYAYKGMPLYTFASDTNGQVTGDNVSNFHIAKP